MRINNNIMAMNTHRQYGINNNNISKSIEKLSSGYRINRAGDDAAGLAISEKMRAQIRGLQMASKNSQDAISLVQTAEGALQESHNILQRMRELAVQSASDTNETTIDRGALEQEFQQLIKELDDTANKTRFNDQNLIDGTFALKNATGTYNGQGVVRTGPKAVDGTYTVQASYTDAVTEIKSAGKAGTINTGALYATSAVSQFEIDFSGFTPPGDSGGTPFEIGEDSVITLTSVEQSSPTTLTFSFEISDANDPTKVNTYSYNLELTPDQLATGLTGKDFVIGDGIKLTITTEEGSTLDEVEAALNGFKSTPITVDDSGDEAFDFAAGSLISVEAGALSTGTLPATAAMNGEWTLSVADASADLSAVTFVLTHGTTGKQINAIVDLSNYDGSADTDVTLDFGDQLGKIQLNFAASASATAEADLAAALEDYSTSFTITGGVDAKTETTPASAKITVDGKDIELKAGMTGFTIEGKDISVAFDRALTADDLASEAALSAFLGGLETEVSVETKDGKALIIQTGANEGDNLAINIDKMDSGYLGVAISSIATRDQASAAITQVNDAINQVSTQRAALGALQNRLDHKIANLDTSAENLQAAESRIRDLDMAKEMTEFTKNNILAQAATAMLAQANALPQGVLQLLQ